MKYVVDVPEVDSNDYELNVCYYSHLLRSFRYIKGHKYEKSDTAEQAWEIAQQILKNPSKNGMLNADLNDCFGTDDIYLIGEMSYTEVKEKYNAWKKSKDEINIGDEIVFYHDDGRPDAVVVVTHVPQVFVDGMDAKGALYTNKSLKKWTKTGRTFPEIVELLEKIGNQDIEKQEKNV